jgi:hypothetical protein
MIDAGIFVMFTVHGASISKYAQWSKDAAFHTSRVLRGQRSVFRGQGTVIWVDR